MRVDIVVAKQLPQKICEDAFPGLPKMADSVILSGHWLAVFLVLSVLALGHPFPYGLAHR